MISENLREIKSDLPPHVELIAVSKTKPSSLILEAHKAGHLHFGENKVQEMAEKAEELPKDICWHLIGHLQTNKVKYIAPFVHLIHSVDSLKLAIEINKRAQQNDRTIQILLQVHIAKEETKFGLSNEEAIELLKSSDFQALKNIKLVGLMGMATNTNDESLIENEFSELSSFFNQIKNSASDFGLNKNEFSTLSMGMSGDYKIAIQSGSTHVRIGSAIFGER
jgi:pyridoxal phosphate enzyme (YggS family)